MNETHLSQSIIGISAVSGAVTGFLFYFVSYHGVTAPLPLWLVVLATSAVCATVLHLMTDRYPGFRDAPKCSPRAFVFVALVLLVPVPGVLHSLEVAGRHPLLVFVNLGGFVGFFTAIPFAYPIWARRRRERGGRGRPRLTPSSGRS
jgi:hypothetical protein